MFGKIFDHFLCPNEVEVRQRRPRPICCRRQYGRLRGSVRLRIRRLDRVSRGHQRNIAALGALDLFADRAAFRFEHLTAREAME